MPCAHLRVSIKVQPSMALVDQVKLMASRPLEHIIIISLHHFASHLAKIYWATATFCSWSLIWLNYSLLVATGNQIPAVEVSWLGKQVWWFTKAMRVNLKQIGLAKTSATIQLRPSIQVTTKKLQQIPFMAEISESFIFSYFFSSEGRNKKKLFKSEFFFLLKRIQVKNIFGPVFFSS